MKIFRKDLFNKYEGHPVRIKWMNNSIIVIAEGAIVATFKKLKKIRQFFPKGNYIKIK